MIKTGEELRKERAAQLKSAVSVLNNIARASSKLSDPWYRLGVELQEAAQRVGLVSEDLIVALETGKVPDSKKPSPKWKGE
jgi:hypothetical protein